ncbi:hypothetical protein [Salibacterium halotolerans]|uniref:LysM domain-containing protein n=1 Tax=Salibacterium halotolerans TaxID=1884432 RepID=A0A1I5NJ13_9BACI|nr:hypothetical protein [Salibacterium halotolerans]SFP21712.1 hypothetical protein SAMN05518683_103163 [Salibacterium halotolerans]
MKKTLFFILFILLSISVYYDLTEGILAGPGEDNSSSSDIIDDRRAVEVTVESGQTLVSITKKLHDGSLPAPVDKITRDFKELNEGVPPDLIQVDSPYRFPLYTPKQDSSF